MMREQERVLNLSRGTCERVTWPPKVGDTVHFNNGIVTLSWQGEIRAVVDDFVAFVRVFDPATAEAFYLPLKRSYVDALSYLFHGPLPEGAGT